MDRYGLPNKMPIKVKGDKELYDKDKVHIMLIFANKFCQLENNLNN